MSMCGGVLSLHRIPLVCSLADMRDSVVYVMLLLPWISITIQAIVPDHTNRGWRTYPVIFCHYTYSSIWRNALSLHNSTPQYYLGLEGVQYNGKCQVSSFLWVNMH